MDPDLMAEYAKEGKLTKDSQFLDGMEVDILIQCGKSKFEEATALYKWDGTTWEYEVSDFEGVTKFILKAYMGVSFKCIKIFAKLDTEEEVLIFKEEYAMSKRTYKTKTTINGKDYEVKIKTK